MDSTKQRLAERLGKDGFKNLAARAAAGEFSDYESPHAAPKMMLVQELNAHLSGKAEQRDKALALIEEIMSDQWDDTKEESEAWFQREGAAALAASIGAIKPPAASQPPMDYEVRNNPCRPGTAGSPAATDGGRSGSQGCRRGTQTAGR